MNHGLSIGELSRQTGCNIQTIRYYEKIGLLSAPPRTDGGQRRYGQDARQRLGFIRHARELGFEILAIRELIALTGEPDKPCADADRIAREQLEAIESRISRLTALRSELKRMITLCRHEKIAECRIVETLGNHNLCRGPHEGQRREAGRPSMGRRQ